MSNLELFHKLRQLKKLFFEDHYQNYWFDEAGLKICWDNPELSSTEIWGYKMSFPDLETMMAYINQQIEIHEQFLARFSE